MLKASKYEASHKIRFLRVVKDDDEEDEEPDYFEYKLDEDGYVKEVKVLLSTGESDIYKYTYENIK